MNNLSLPQKTERAHALASEIRARLLVILSLEDPFHKLEILFQAFLSDKKADDPDIRDRISYLYFWILMPLLKGEFDRGQLVFEIDKSRIEDLTTLLNSYWLSDFVDGAPKGERKQYSELINSFVLVLNDLQEYNLYS